MTSFQLSFFNNLILFDFINFTVPVYQLGYSTVCLTGQILMSAGLPVKFYTLDDSVSTNVLKVNLCFFLIQFYSASLSNFFDEVPPLSADFTDS